MERQSDRIRTLKRIYGLLGKKKGLLYGLLVFKSLDLVLGIVQPFFYYLFIDHVIVKGKMGDLPIVIAGYLSVFVLQTLLIKLTRRSYNTLFLKLKMELRVHILKRYMNMNADTYQNYSTGDLADRIDGDVEFIETFLQKHVMDYFFSVAKILVISVILFVLNHTLTIIGFIAIPLSFWLVRVISRKANRVSEERRRLEGEYHSFLNNSFQKWADIKTNNLEDYMEAEFETYRQKLSKLIIKSQIYIAFNWLFIAFKDYFITRMNLYFVGGILIIYKKLTVGILLTYMDYFMQLVDSITSVVNSILDFHIQKPNIQRVFEILELEYDVKRRVTNLEDKITFSNVSFRYADNQKWVIRSLNMTIDPGEHIAIVGKSGCGKTTLANLLMGVYEPCGGEILLGSRRISELSHESISNKIGIVSQFPRLLNLSIRENLLLADRHAGDEEIGSACEKANILSFIESLPDQFETNIGERGIKLSGGQRQRLSIARLLLQDPDIIIFDESTRSLDSCSEKEILDTIRSFSGSKTIITIAHRLSTVLVSDRVLLMEEGRIAAVAGSPEIMTDEKFRELFEHQRSLIKGQS